MSDSGNPFAPPTLEASPGKAPGTSIEAALFNGLVPLGFKRHSKPIEGHGVRAAWTRKTWNTNRGVVLVELPEGEDPGLWAQALKLPVGKQLGYFPVLYGIGLQVVLVGDAAGVNEASLMDHVDRFDNQRSILQSLHLYDATSGQRISARTWGQVVTGRFQDAMEAALDRLPPNPAMGDSLGGRRGG